MNTSKIILVVIGTRPEAIKLAPLIKLLSIHFKVFCICTGQHSLSVIEILDLFQIKPTIINTHKKFKDINTQLNNYQKFINIQITFFKPDLIIVHGDTTSCFAGALSGFFAKIPIAHIESGLRTQNKYAPFPEEMYRKWTDAVADLCFAPTSISKNNLINEGINPGKIFITGNTIVDAITYVKNIISINENQFASVVNKKPIPPNFILVTLHRNEIRDSKLEKLAIAICQIAKEKKYHILWPMHPNKIVSNIIRDVLTNQSHVIVTKSLDYKTFIGLIQKAKMIITDSGGIQEEASVMGKKILILREETERPEVLENKSAILAGTDHQKLSKYFTELENLDLDFENNTDIFGAGDATNKIVNAISNFFISSTSQ